MENTRRSRTEACFLGVKLGPIDYGDLVEDKDFRASQSSIFNGKRMRFVCAWGRARIHTF